MDAMHEFQFGECAMKIIKWFFISLLAVVVCLALYLTFFFDLNDYKPELVNLVKDKTGRDLTLDKELKWTVYPSLGIEVEKLALSAPKGFKDKMLTVNKAVAEVSFLPLLSKEVEIKRLNFDGIHLNLVTKKDGRTSLDGLSSDNSASEPTVDSVKANSAPNSDTKVLNGLHINGISISDVSVKTVDEKSNVVNQFKVKQLHLDDFELAQDTKLSFEIFANVAKNTITSEGSGLVNINRDLSKFSLKALNVNTSIEGKALPNGVIKNTVSLDGNVNTKTKTASLKLKSFNIDNINSSGQADVNFGRSIPYVKAALNVGVVNLSDFKVEGNDAEKDSKPVHKSETKTTGSEPDLTALKSLNADILLTVKAINYDKIKTTNWNVSTSLKNGKLDVKDFSGHLYEGKLSTTATLLEKNSAPDYQFKTALSGVQIQPLLKDAADLDILAGTTLFNLSGHGTSLNPDKVLENLVAQGSAEFADGVIYGVNIPHMIRNAKAKLKGKPTEEVKEKKTDFTRLGTDFKIAKGVVSLSETEMASPLLRLKGEGDANLVKKTVDYLLQTEIVASLKGQKSEKDELSGIKIPLRISGEFSNPKFSIDTKALLDNKIDKEKEKLKDKVKDKLFKKFGL